MEHTVFNEAQLDILNMMQWVKSPEALSNLKQAISDFFAKKAKEEMDALWANGTMTQEKFDSLPPSMRELHIVNNTPMLNI